METGATVDRRSRDSFSAAIEQFLSGELTAFRFEDAAVKIASDSNDQLLKQTLEWLNPYFIDAQDWTYQGDKDSWDYFQRILLLLESDANVRESRQTRRIHMLAAVLRLTALGYLIAYAAVWYVGPDFLAVAAFHLLPFVSLALVVAHKTLFTSNTDEKRMEALYPFDSITQLLSVRRSVPKFTKRHFQPRSAADTQRHGLRYFLHLAWEAVGIAAYAVMWIIALYLLLLGMPVIALCVLIWRQDDSSFSIESPSLLASPEGTQTGQR